MADEPTKGPQTAKTAPLIHLLSQGRAALVTFQDDVLTLRSKSGETTETVRATDIADVQLRGQTITNRMTVQTKQGRSISINGLDRAISQTLQAQLHARMEELLNNEAAGNADALTPEILRLAEQASALLSPDRYVRHSATVGLTDSCPLTRPENRRPNAPRFEVRGHLYRMTGVDLTRINGVDAYTALKVISEVGTDMTRWPTAKHFASWLGLSPNNRVTVGRVISSRTKPSANRAAKALRLAANALYRSNSALGAFLRRKKAQLGPPKAITATAHKLARIIYSMLRNGHGYVDAGAEYYERQHRQRALRAATQRAAPLGYQLVPLAEVLASPLSHTSVAASADSSGQWGEILSKVSTGTGC